jgi:GNAT superfamily N-acetyltransferase
MKVQRALVEDAETILQLQKRAYCNEAEIYNDYNIPPLLQTLDEIKEGFMHHHVFLKAIEENGTIIGSVRSSLEKETACIGRLIVQPECQNKGIGTILMRSIEQYFVSTKRYELFTGHMSLRNLYLYRKLGYREFKRIPVTNSLTMVFMDRYKENK